MPLLLGIQSKTNAEILKFIADAFMHELSFMFAKSTPNDDKTGC